MAARAAGWELPGRSSEQDLFSSLTQWKEAVGEAVSLEARDVFDLQCLSWAECTGLHLILQANSSSPVQTLDGRWKRNSRYCWHIPRSLGGRTRPQKWNESKDCVLGAVLSAFLQTGGRKGSICYNLKCLRWFRQGFSGTSFLLFLVVEGATVLKVQLLT